MNVEQVYIFAYSSSTRTPENITCCLLKNKIENVKKQMDESTKFSIVSFGGYKLPVNNTTSTDHLMFRTDMISYTTDSAKAERIMSFISKGISDIQKIRSNIYNQISNEINNNNKNSNIEIS